MSVDNRTIGEILNDPEATPEPEETDEPESLADAKPTERREGNAFRAVDIDSIEYVPTVKAAREEAQIPEHVSVKDLEGRRIVIARKFAQKAALPDTGELRDGWFCDIIDVETRKAQTTWIGQVALMRDLSQLQTPFQATIVKHGRTYRFQ